MNRPRNPDRVSRGETTLPGKIVFFLIALPAVVRVAARVQWSYRRHPLDAQVERLRDVPPFRFSWLARRPLLLAGCVERLQPLLPPRGHGPCLKRCLHLLDLWARCGLEPELCMGLQGEAAFREGHAWVVSRRDPAIRTSAQSYEEAFRF